MFHELEEDRVYMRSFLVCCVLWDHKKLSGRQLLFISVELKFHKYVQIQELKGINIGGI